jgi:modulator of FtsH protease HflK
MPSDTPPSDENKRKKDRRNPWGRTPGESSTPGERPYSQGPRRGPGRPQGPAQPPGIDDIFARLNEGLRDILPGNMQRAPLVLLGVGAVVILWLGSGLYVVNPGENAVIQRFGAWSRTQDQPGLGYHLPAPIEQATIVNVQEIRRLSVGAADMLPSRGGQSRTATSEESLMLTSDRNIVDLTLEVQWNVKNSENFLFNIEDQDGTIKKVGESAIREIVGQTPMFQIITNQRQQVADRTKAIIQSNLDEYHSGVNITQVLIQRAEVHPDVQDAFQDVQSAKQDAEDVQNRAQAYREDIIPKARGQAIQLSQQAEAYRQATADKAKGDADRFNAIYSAYQSGKDVTKERIYLETMEEVLKNARKIILDGKQAQGVVPYLPLRELGAPKNNATTAPDTADAVLPAKNAQGLQ